MEEGVVERGLDTEAIRRLGFRLNFILKAISERKVILKNGNLASWEPELMATLVHFEDLTDTVFELLTLIGTTLNQKEQGLISPPKEVATSSDNPEGS